MCVDLFRLCFQIKLQLFFNVTSSFNINGMIHILIIFIKKLLFCS
jgi:hypothetical protein